MVIGDATLANLSAIQFQRARDLMRGVDVLFASSPDCGPATTFNVAWTLEFTLQAYLLHCGCSERALQKINHDLLELWKAAAVGYGLPNTAATPPAWCQEIARWHNRPFHLRYSNVNGLYSEFTVADYVGGVRAVFNEVDKSLHA